MVTPIDKGIPVGTSFTYEATAIYSDNSSVDVSATSAWSVENELIAQVVPGGTVTTTAVGDTRVVAKFGEQQGVAGVISTAAVPVSVTIEPAEVTAPVGTVGRLTLYATYSDGIVLDVTAQASWQSSDPDIVFIQTSGPNAGSGELLQPGTADVSAQFGDLNDSIVVTVTEASLERLIVLPDDAAVPLGLEVNYSATGIFSDGSSEDLTSEVSWSSSDQAVATIAAGGVASTLSVGTTEITAAYAGLSASTRALQRNQAATVDLTVTSAEVASVSIQPGILTGPAGSSAQLQLQATYTDGTTETVTTQATWLSDDYDVVTVVPTGATAGYVELLTVGTTQISASFGEATDSINVDVTAAVLDRVVVDPGNASLAVGVTQQYAATAVYSDNSSVDITDAAAWESSDTDVASVVPGGLAIANAEGSATISAQYQGEQGSGALTVTAAELDSLTIFPGEVNAPVGTSGQLQLNATFSDGSKQDVTADATWISDDFSVAQVIPSGADAGMGILVGVGTTTVSASYGGLSTSIPVTATAAVLLELVLSPDNAQVPAGNTVQYSATGIYSDNTSQDLTADVSWTSSDKGVATIADGGLASALVAGNTDITATYAGITASTRSVDVDATVPLVVTAAELFGVNIVEGPVEGPAGITVQRTLQAQYSDGSTALVTEDATWFTGKPDVASVVSTGTGAGEVSLLSKGATRLIAIYQNRRAGVDVTVTEALLDRIEVTPSSATLPDGTSQQFEATAFYGDGTSESITTSANWSIEPSEIAQVSSEGLVTALMPGDALVSASFDNQTDEASLTVTEAVVTDFQVIPGKVEGPQGTTEQLKAYAVFSNSDQREVTADTTWMSDDAAIASVGNSAGDKGLVTLKQEGSTQIKAAYADEEYLVDVTVVAAQLVELQVAPQSAAVAAGVSQQYVATGVYSDQSTSDLTDEVFWTSSDNEVASINTSGLARTYKTGDVIITASEPGSGLQQTAQLTVTDALLQSVRIVPGEVEGPAGTQAVRQLIATYSDGTDSEVSEQATWSVMDTQVASVVTTGIGAGTVSLKSSGVTTLAAEFDGEADSVQVTVTDALLVDFVVTPGQASIADGTTQKFTATAYYGDNTSRDVSAEAAWTSSDGTVATVDPASGLATAVGAGNAVITASFESSTDDAQLEVTAATVESLTITPALVEGALGTSVQLKAEATYSNSTTQDVTTQSLWTSQNGSVAIVSSGAGGGLVGLVGEGSTTVTASFGGASEDVPVTVTAAVLEQLAIEPENASVASGLSQQYKAIGIYSDGSNQDLTEQVSWASSDQDVARIDSVGLATTGVAGETTISAIYTPPSGALRAILTTVSADTTLTVTDAEVVGIQVDPVQLELPIGTNSRLKLYAELSDGGLEEVTTEANWQSANASIIEVVADGVLAGTVTARGLGTAQVTANYRGFNSSAQVTGVDAIVERFVVLPGEASLPAGNTQKFTAWAYYSDNSPRDVSALSSWNSSDKAVAVVDGEGNATTLTAGSSTISATFSAADGAVFKDSSVLVATAALVVDLQISPSSLDLPVGREQALTLTAFYSDGTNEVVSSQSSWTSSDSSIATVVASGSEGGLVRGVAEGNATITASYSGINETAEVLVNTAVLESIAVSPQQASVPVGEQVQFAAQGTYSDGSTPDLTTQVSWRSSDPVLASIDQTGLSTTNAEGDVAITATLDGVIGEAQLEITAATAVSIDVTPASIEGPVGTTQQLIATASFTDGSSLDVTASTVWSSDDTSVAEVEPSGSSAGLVSLRGEGSAEITAAYRDVPSVTVPVTVTGALLESVSIEPVDASIGLRSTQQYTAIASFADGSTADVTDQMFWRSSEVSVATIAQGGLATAAGVGVTTITGTLLYEGQSYTDSTSLSVFEVPLREIIISPTNATVVAGFQQQFMAMAVYEDDSTSDVTAQSSWNSSDQSVATIDQSGLAQTLAAGSSSITADFAGKTGTASLTATAATLVDIQILPGSVTGAAGSSIQLTLLATYSTGYQEEVTTQAIWSSDTPEVASVVASGSQAGLLSLERVGNAMVSADFGGFVKSIPVTVTAALLQDLVIAPLDASIAAGVDLQYTAYAVYSDGSNQNVTGQTQWGSSAETVATINNDGLASGVASGSTIISAAFESLTKSTSLTVTAATLDSIVILPGPISGPAGTQSQLSLQAAYSDGTTDDVTQSATWISLNNSVASVIATGPEAGLVSFLAAGTTDVRASFGGLNTDVPVTVSEPSLVNLTVAPATASIPAGLTQQYTATAEYDNGDLVDVSNSAAWTSSDTAVASIEPGGLARGIASGETTITATFSEVDATASLEVTFAELVSVQVDPTSVRVPAGTKGQLSLYALFSDNSQQDVTASATWQSSDETIVSVVTAGTEAGFATAMAVGSAAVTATYQGESDTSAIEVTDATLVELQVTPRDEVVALGLQVAYTAIGIFSDGSNDDLTTQVSWSSSDTEIASVGNDGVANTYAVGSTDITANFAGVTATARANADPVSDTTALTVTDAEVVSIVIPEGPVDGAVGTQAQRTLEATYSDGRTETVTTQGKWTTADPQVAEVVTTGSEAGLVSLLTEGTTKLSASFEGQTTSVNVQVTGAALVDVVVTPAVQDIPLGNSFTYTATAIYSDNSSEDVSQQAVWTVQDSQIASVAPGGTVTGKTTGTTAVFADFNGEQGSASAVITAAVAVSVAIDPAEVTAPVGTVGRLTLYATYSDGIVLDVTAQASWQSSDPTTVFIETSGPNAGSGELLQPGTADVGAQFGDLTDSIVVTVTEATLEQLIVLPDDAAVPLGLEVNYSATGIFSDGSSEDLTSEVSWSSSNQNVATIATGGVASTLAVGTTEITAAYAGLSASTRALQRNQSATVELTVTAAEVASVSIQPGSLTGPAGTNAQLQLQATYTDGATETVTTQATWLSDDYDVATVVPTGAAAGYVELLNLGTTLISASFGEASDQINVTVNEAVLDRVVVSPGSLSLAVGNTAPFTATAIYSNNSSVDVTDTADWSSSDTGVVTDAPGGVATAKAEGQATLTARFEGEEGTAALTVTAAELESIAIFPGEVNAPVGTTGGLQLTATFSDGSSLDVTTSATWLSDDLDVAQVVPNGPDAGTGILVGVGSTQVSATYQELTTSIPVTVTAAELVELVLSPDDAQVPAGNTVQYSATGIYSDNTSTDLTDDVSWSSSVTAVATISPGGLATTETAGNTDISATYSGVTASTRSTDVTVSVPLVVTAAELVGVSIVEGPIEGPAGVSVQRTLQAQYSDGTTALVTEDATWFTGKPEVATVVTTGADAGEVTLLRQGATRLVAVFQGRRAGVDITVTPALLDRIEVTPASATLPDGTSQ